MKTVTLWKGKNNCQRCKLSCNGHVHIEGEGYGFPLILCKKCGRKIRNGLQKELSKPMTPSINTGKI